MPLTSFPWSPAAASMNEANPIAYRSLDHGRTVSRNGPVYRIAG